MTTDEFHKQLDLIFDVRDCLLGQILSHPSKPILAGGAVRDLVLHASKYPNDSQLNRIKEPRDFDFFVPSKEAADLLLDFIHSQQDIPAGSIIKTEFAYTISDIVVCWAENLLTGKEQDEYDRRGDDIPHYDVKTTIQIIFRLPVTSPADLIEHHFDFTCTQFALTIEDGKVTIHYVEKALTDAEHGDLNYTGNTTCPFSSLVRTYKYVARGYTIPRKQLANLVADIARRYGEGKGAEDLSQSLYDG